MNCNKSLRDLLDAIEKQEQQVRLYEGQLATLNNQRGQSLCTMSVCGVQYNISTLDRESGWNAYTIKGMEKLRDEAINIVDIFLRNAKKNLEETKFKYIQLSKEI